MNQLIIAYHVLAEGEVRLGEELAEYKHVDFDKARYWPTATGLALRDFLRGRGFEPEAFEFPSLKKG
ncbi:MAG TPA: ADP-ribose pyrophosphatase, partial [Solimonas sp.]|nr:ADP-ribose pyrophosphatase [Solimonas sp.]